MDIDNYDFADPVVVVINTEKGDQFYVVDRIVQALEGKG
jgi:hypothetical protein